MKIPHFKILVSIFMTIILGSCSTDDDFLIDGDFTRSIDMEKVSPTDLYPQEKDIIADKTVKTAMDSAWIETLSLANKNGRQEIGFYIYYDFDTKEFSIGKKKYGPVIPNEEDTHGTLTMGPVINNGNVCAVFHTHTPTFYLSSYLARPTGPSEADISLSESYGLPGIVYDYAAKTAKGGMPLNSQARLYTFGVDHRKNPYNENDN